MRNQLHTHPPRQTIQPKTQQELTCSYRGTTNASKLPNFCKLLSYKTCFARKQKPANGHKI